MTPRIQASEGVMFAGDSLAMAIRRQARCEKFLHLGALVFSLFYERQMRRGGAAAEGSVKKVFDGSPRGFGCGVCHAVGTSICRDCSVLLPNEWPE